MQTPFIRNLERGSLELPENLLLSDKWEKEGA